MAKHISSGHQLANILTKPLGKTQVDFICTSWACVIYMLQLEGESQRYIRIRITPPLEFLIVVGLVLDYYYIRDGGEAVNHSSLSQSLNHQHNLFLDNLYQLLNSTRAPSIIKLETHQVVHRTANKLVFSIISLVNNIALIFLTIYLILHIILLLLINLIQYYYV